MVEEGFEWTTEGFESCSLSPRRADAFGKEFRICYIVPPSEGVGIYIGEGTYRSDGHSLSDISGQKEFLTARNIRKRVLKVRNIGPGRKEVTAVIIPPTGRYNGLREMGTHHSG